MKFFRINKFSLFVCVLAVFFISCRPHENSLQTQYGEDAKYFIALQLLDSGNEKEASRLLKQCSKKGTSVIARNAFETWASLGTVQEKNKKYKALYKNYPDSDALELYLQELDAESEYAQIIKLTDTLEEKDFTSQIKYYRLKSMQKKNDSRFMDEGISWLLNSAFGKYQNQLSEEIDFNNALVDFRKLILNQKYTDAEKLLDTVISSPHLTASLMSDAGKCFLYASSNYIQNAGKLQSEIEKLPESALFYGYFYTGRLYEKAGDYFSLASKNFLSAMEKAETPQQYDNALWYYLKIQLKISVVAAVNAVKKYCSTWNDPSYFDDFFDTLSIRLFSNHNWKSFYDIAVSTDGYASSDVTAQFSYITARLIQEGFIKTPEIISEEEKLLYRTLKCKSALYYNLNAAHRLSIPQNQIISEIFNEPSKKFLEFTPDPDAEKLLNGYADFGLLEYIYPQWQKHQNEIGNECVKKISLFLKNCGTSQNDYYTKSLRIASRKFYQFTEAADTELLELVFPRNFEEDVSESCTKFNLPEKLFYSLIRSESFFNPTITSSAGAIGLTQLMKSTADDVARKLKLSEYDLSHSSTNILLGSYYLEELRRRLDYSDILALFAYNAGITRVRNWVKSAKIEFASNSLPDDLFLEEVPFSETREYGRKLVSAAAMYGMLYYNESVSSTISGMLK